MARRSDGPSGPSTRFRVEVVTAGGARAPGLARWLQGVAPPRARGAVTIAVVSDNRIRQLNRDYRGKDAPTDVLAFPAAAPPARGRGTPDERGMLGDIVIAQGVARRQARDAGHPLGAELRVLALHGLLHLLGYDHERDHGQMRRLEQRLRRRGGLGEGLIEREQGPGARGSRRA